MTATGFVLLLVGLLWIKFTTGPADLFMPPTGWLWMVKLAMMLLGGALIIAGLTVFLWRNMP